MGAGAVAVKGKADAHQIVMQPWIPQGARGVGQMAKGLVVGQVLQHLIKAGLLQPGHTLTITFGVTVRQGEMAVDAA